MRERDDYKAQMEAAQEENRQLRREVQRLRAELALLRSPLPETQDGEAISPQNEYRAILSDEQIWLSFPYDPTVLRFNKRVPGGQWEQPRKEKPTTEALVLFLILWRAALDCAWKSRSST